MENQEEGPIEDLFGGHARCSVVAITPSAGHPHGIGAR